MLIDDIRPEDHLLLLQDDMPAWYATNRYTPAHLDAWVKAHTLQAIDLGKVLVSWKPMSSRYALEVLFGYLTVALEDLPEHTKTDILNGHPENDVQRYIYENLENNPKNWEVASPTWCGEPGSLLRTRAEQLGWSPLCLVTQVVEDMQRQKAPAWTSWLLYPHCMTVYRKAMAGQETNVGEVVQWLSAPWASPRDVALAQLLHDHMVVPHEQRGKRLQAHPAVGQLPCDEHQELREMVGLHLGLGMMEELFQNILRGTLPLASKQATKSTESISYEGLLQP